MDKAERKTRAASMFRSYVSGNTLQEIGDQYGLTRERIRQILDRSYGDRVHFIRQVNKESDTRVRAKKSAKTCPVCLREHNRSATTCSHRCSELHVLTRYRRDGDYRERHRIFRAKSVRKHKDKYTPDQVRHAEAILDGTARRYTRARWHARSRAAAAVLEMEGLRGIID
jgi:predicted nucleic acid-binding Zn ribbon protein